MKDYSRINISIIGFGNVGRCILNNLLQDDHRQFLINIIDPSTEISGSQRDLGQAALLDKRHHIVWGSNQLFKEADFIFYSAGVPVPKGKCRDHTLAENRTIVRQVFEGYQPAHSPVIITLTNPLDAIARDILKLTKLPNDNVFGIGTMIETLRMEYLISQVSGVDIDKVHALVVGEHGETMVPILSHTFINDVPIKQTMDEHLISDCVYETRRMPHRIKETQGASYFAASMAATFVLRKLLNGNSSFMPLSIYHEKEDLFYSVPVRFSAHGIEAMVMSLTIDELEALEASKEKIRSMSPVSQRELEIGHIDS